MYSVNEIIVYDRETINQIEKIQQTRGGKTRTIKFVGFPSNMAKYVPKIILDFQKNNTHKIKFLLFEGTYEEGNEMINKGIIDLEYF